jgi:hypothetical protein
VPTSFRPAVIHDTYESWVTAYGNRQFRKSQVPVGRKVFLAVVLSQLFSIALIFGWYFCALRSELGSLTRDRAREAVLQSIAATEDYFKPAEMAADAGQLLLSDHILGLDKSDPLERYFFWAASSAAASGGALSWQPRRRILLCYAQQREGKVIRNGPSGREVELTWRQPD